LKWWECLVQHYGIIWRIVNKLKLEIKMVCLKNVKATIEALRGINTRDEWKRRERNDYRNIQM
jgi:hypothetical protein